MTYRSQRFSPASALAAGCVFSALMAALLAGLRGAPISTAPERTLIALNLEAPPPTPREKRLPRIVHSPKPQGKAAPAGLRARATDLVLPTPVLVLPPPVLMASAPIPGAGVANRAGNSDVPGLGPGSGGAGNGTGSGDAGDGDGNGGDTAPVQRRGRLKMSDFPASAGEITREWIVGVRYMVEVNGRVSRCEIRRPSGLPPLDAIICPLIQKRFRFDPSRDADGAPVPAWVVESHGWGPTHDPAASADQ